MFSVTPFSAAHESFYKKTVARLIAAQELPAIAMKLFDETFSASVIA